MKRLIAGVLCLLMLSACSYKEYNAQVERMNMTRFRAFADGLAKQKSEAGRMAVTMAFMTGVGQQTLAKPETVADYLPIVNAFALPWATMFIHRDKNKATLSAGHDLYYYSNRTNNSTGEYSDLMGNYNGITMSPDNHTEEMPDEHVEQNYTENNEYKVKPVLKREPR